MVAAKKRTPKKRPVDVEVIQHPKKSSPFVVTGGTYDFFNKLVRVIMPGFATLYVALAAIWDLPAADEVAQTTVALVAFLGLFVDNSSRQYKKSEQRFDGQITVDESGEKKVISFDTGDRDPEEMLKKNEVTFKVSK